MKTIKARLVKQKVSRLGSQGRHVFKKTVKLGYKLQEEPTINHKMFRERACQAEVTACVKTPSREWQGILKKQEEGCSR